MTFVSAASGGAGDHALSSFVSVTPAAVSAVKSFPSFYLRLKNVIKQLSLKRQYNFINARKSPQEN